MITLDDDAFIQSDDDVTPSAFSQSLRRFQKSPKKKGRLDDYYLRIYACITLRTIARLTRHSDDDDDDDDDFIVPDDSEDDVASRSSRASKRSSRRSLSSGYEEEAGTQTTKAKSAVGAIGRPSLTKTLGAGGSVNASTTNFLTAAEQRAQATKDEKKTQDDPFYFLLDVRDVCILVSSW